MKLIAVALMLICMPRVATAKFADDCAEMAKGTNCKTLTECKVSDSEGKDASAFACWLRLAETSCLDALSTKPAKGSRLNDADKIIVAAYYKLQDASSVCERRAFAPIKFLEGPLKTSIWTTTNQRGLAGGEHAVQVMPSVALGIPFGIDDQRESGKALKTVELIAGVAARYTPSSYLFAFHAFVGSTSADSSEIDEVLFPNPVLVLTGFGIDVGAGAVSLSVVNARLHKDGLRSSSGDNQWFAQIAFDLTALGIGLTSAN